MLALQMILIHFYLASLTSSLHFDIIHSSLIRYFPYGSLQVFEVLFDFGTSCGWKGYGVLIKDLLVAHGSEIVHIMVVITNHTDDMCGDLFISQDSMMGEHVAATVEEVSFIHFKTCQCC